VLTVARPVRISHGARLTAMFSVRFFMGAQWRFGHAQQVLLFTHVF
jgi:hypothetical protein